MEKAIRDLANGIRDIRDEQSYMVARERVHQLSKTSIALNIPFFNFELVYIPSELNKKKEQFMNECKSIS